MISNRIHSATNQAHNFRTAPQQVLKHCADCPHKTDCTRVGPCLDEVNARYLADHPNQFPRLMTPGQATSCMAALNDGRTLRRFTNGGKLGKAIVSLTKFKNHCAAYPEWGGEALRLAVANSKAADALKGLPWRERTKDLCLKGLHPMIGANVRIDPSRGRRACLACRYIARDNPPLIKPDVLAKIRQAFEAGASYGQICNGQPVGGGKIDRSLILTTSHKLYQQRRIDPEFNRFVATHIADSNSTGQKKRWHRVMTHIRTTAARSEANDYHDIRAMIPANFPDKDDIVSRIFEDLLSGALGRESVRSRVTSYINEHNRMFPTKYAKFGDRPLVSLDEVLFEDGTATRGDTVTRGLWD
jgi:hypothetical protein